MNWTNAPSSIYRQSHKLSRSNKCVYLDVVRIDKDVSFIPVPLRSKSFRFFTFSEFKNFYTPKSFILLHFDKSIEINYLEVTSERTKRVSLEKLLRLRLSFFKQINESGFRKSFIPLSVKA